MSSPVWRKSLLGGRQLIMGPLTIATYPGIFWLRFCGWGLALKNVDHHPLLFSERNGFVRRIQIGKWSLKALRPGRA